MLWGRLRKKMLWGRFLRKKMLWGRFLRKKMLWGRFFLAGLWANHLWVWGPVHDTTAG